MARVMWSTEKTTLGDCQSVDGKPKPGLEELHSALLHLETVHPGRIHYAIEGKSGKLTVWKFVTELRPRFR